MTLNFEELVVWSFSWEEEKVNPDGQQKDPWWWGSLIQTSPFSKIDPFGKWTPLVRMLLKFRVMRVCQAKNLQRKKREQDLIITEPQRAVFHISTPLFSTNSNFRSIHNHLSFEFIHETFCCPLFWTDPHRLLQTLKVEALLQPRKIIVMDDTTTVNEALKVRLCIFKTLVNVELKLFGLDFERIQNSFSSSYWLEGNSYILIMEEREELNAEYEKSSFKLPFESLGDCLDWSICST